MKRIAALALVLLLTAPVARAAEPVDLALVLVTDVSRSIDDSEYDLEKKGTASAFLDPAVQAAVHAGPNGAIAVAYIEFAGSSQVQTVIDFTIIHDTASAQAFADKLVTAPRSFYGRTAISAGIDAAMELLTHAPFEATRRVIDVCGDGTNNAGREITEARDDALKEGVIINGLTIINDHPVSYTFAHVAPPGGLTNWYREHVTGGPGSFVLEVHDFQTFGEAMRRKLISEIAALTRAGTGGPG
jgi:hypothetical protein